MNPDSWDRDGRRIARQGSDRRPRPARGSAKGLRSKLVGAVLVLAVLGANACGGDGVKTRFYSLGTGGTGGIYYPLGGGIASRLSAADSTATYTAEVTGGSVENVNRVTRGQIDLGFALAITAYQAYRGVGDYEGRGEPGLRIIAPLYPNRVHLLAGRGSEARGVADLRGASVAVGSAGSGTEQSAREILAAYGLGYEDVDVRYLSFAESAAALRDGAVDAAFLSVGFPAGAVLEATTTGGARLLPIDGPGAGRLFDEHPYYQPGSIPAGTYPGLDEDLQTVSMMNWIVGMDTLDPLVVRSLLNVLGPGRVSLERVHEMAAQIDISDLSAAPIPVHEETLRWLEDAGS